MTRFNGCSPIATPRFCRRASLHWGLLLLAFLVAGCGKSREQSANSANTGLERENAARVDVRFPSGDVRTLDIAASQNLAGIKKQLTPAVQQAIQTALDASKPESGELVRFATVFPSHESEKRQVEYPPLQQAELKMSFSVGTIEHRILLKTLDGFPGLTLVTERRANANDQWRQIKSSQIDLYNRPRKIEPWVVGRIVDSMADPIDAWNQFRQAELPL